MQAFKIFPGWITPDGRKVPVISNWQTLASNDPNQIKQWQETYREKITHWGIPTGRINDLLVLDVDVKTNGFKTIQDKHLMLPETMGQRTVSGGYHFFFKYPNDGREHGNRVGFLPGLDSRGDGGYIFFYGADNKPLADPPQWFIEETAKLTIVSSGQPSIRVAPEIAAHIIQESINAIVSAPAGESNNILNVEAFRVGQLVASGSVPRDYAEKVLFDAAIARGKPHYEARATIKSGLDGGGLKPLTSPFGSAPPTSQIEIPPPPAPEGRWTPQYFTKEDLLDTSKLRRPQLFQDWSTEDITITTADGGTGKTTLKLYEAICLALGDRFLGFDCKQTGKTLFITGEDTDKKLAAMLGMMVRQMGLFENLPGNNEKIQTILSSIVIKKDADLCIVQKDRQGFLHLNGDALRKVMEAVHDFKPKMIVFDPISSFWGSEAALNDMNKAVIKFMSYLVDHSHACVEMINHLGKQSSANKDMSQFAGRGGSGLPSNSRVSRALRQIDEDEYRELTGEDLTDKQSAIMCNVNKFTDGSPLYNKPFLIVREGYLFSRKLLTPQKAREVEKAMSDIERVFTYVKDERRRNKFPTKTIITGHFMMAGSDPLSEARVKRTLDQLCYAGNGMGEFLKAVENPDLTSKDKVYIVTDQEGKEN